MGPRLTDRQTLRVTRLLYSIPALLLQDASKFESNWPVCSYVFSVGMGKQTKSRTRFSLLWLEFHCSYSYTMNEWRFKGLKCP